MNFNNQTTQDCADSPMDQTENIFAPLDNNSIPHTSINNVGMPNTNLNTLHINNINTINTATPTHQNTIFEFYFHLPNDTRIYRVTYSELHPSENIRLLNNSINLSHIPDYQFPHHHNIQSQIQHQIQIQQQVQQPVYYQQNSTIQQQSFDTMMYSDNNNTASVSVDGAISDDMQDTGYDGVNQNDSYSSPKN